MTERTKTTKSKGKEKLSTAGADGREKGERISRKDSLLVGRVTKRVRVRVKRGQNEQNEHSRRRESGGCFGGVSELVSLVHAMPPSPNWLPFFCRLIIVVVGSLLSFHSFSLLMPRCDDLPDDPFAWTSGWCTRRPSLLPSFAARFLLFVVCGLSSSDWSFDWCKRYWVELRTWSFAMMHDSNGDDDVSHDSVAAGKKTWETSFEIDPASLCSEAQAHRRVHGSRTSVAHWTPIALRCQQTCRPRDPCHCPHPIASSDAGSFAFVLCVPFSPFGRGCGMSLVVLPLGCC